MATNRVQKMITFPKELCDMAERKAKRYGLLLPEYIRHLLLEDIEREEREYVEIADEELEKSIAASLEDLKKGKYVTFDGTSRKSIRDAFKKLEKMDKDV